MPLWFFSVRVTVLHLIEQSLRDVTYECVDKLTLVCTGTEVVNSSLVDSGVERGEIYFIFCHRRF